MKKGQFIMGRKKAAEALGMPESTFYANIKKLVGYGLVSIESNNQYSIVTLSEINSKDEGKCIDKQQKTEKSNATNDSIKQPDNTNKNAIERNKKNTIINKNSCAVSLDPKDSPSSTKPKSSDPIIAWSYKRLQNYIQNRCPDISKLPIQLNIDQYEALANLYDWTDIQKKLDDLEAWDGLTDQNRVYKILRTFLQRDDDVRKIDEFSSNSILKDWENLKRQKAKQKEDKRKRKILKKKQQQQQAFFMEIKDSAIWEEEGYDYDEDERQEVVGYFFSFVDKIASIEYLSKQYGESPLTIEEYLAFKILYNWDEALIRFLTEFKDWGKERRELSFSENFAEFLMEKAVEPDDGY